MSGLSRPSAMGRIPTDAERPEADLCASERSARKPPFEARYWSLFEVDKQIYALRRDKEVYTPPHSGTSYASLSCKLCQHCLTVEMLGDSITQSLSNATRCWITNTPPPAKKIGEGSIPVHEGLRPSTRPLHKNCRRPMPYPQGQFRFVSTIFYVVRFGLRCCSDRGKLRKQSPIAGLCSVQ